jgi:hypothetical protein
VTRTLESVRIGSDTPRISPLLGEVTFLKYSISRLVSFAKECAVLCNPQDKGFP